ncbi:hypothetical protein J3F83DRAFT_401134 [Trichoderma novae-zelandiae]
MSRPAVVRGTSCAMATVPSTVRDLPSLVLVYEVPAARQLLESAVPSTVTSWPALSSPPGACACPLWPWACLNLAAAATATALLPREVPVPLPLPLPLHSSRTYRTYRTAVPWPVPGPVGLPPLNRQKQNRPRPGLATIFLLLALLPPSCLHDSTDLLIFSFLPFPCGSASETERPGLRKKKSFRLVFLTVCCRAFDHRQILSSLVGPLEPSSVPPQSVLSFPIGFGPFHCERSLSGQRRIPSH